MSEQSKFINTYIDVIIGTVHEKTNSILQLKTQLKVSSDLLADKDEQIARITSEKDQEIEKLKSEIEKIQNNATDYTGTIQNHLREIENLKSQLSKNNQEFEALKNKAAHTDSLLQQVVAMKQEIKNRDAIINEKEATIIQKNNIINDKDAIIAQKNSLINEKETLISTKEQELEELRQREVDQKPKKAKPTSKSMDLTEINKVLELQKQKDDF